jgi:hypothetical protein
MMITETAVELALLRSSFFLLMRFKGLFPLMEKTSGTQTPFRNRIALQPIQSWLARIETKNHKIPIPINKLANQSVHA